MIEIATGLVLRTRLLTETSLIAHWLTPSLGRLATVAKGARRAKSPFRGKLDLFYLADFSFTRSRRSDLHTLGEVSLCQSYNGLRKDLHYLQQASYCAELLEQNTESETPLPDIFDLMLGLLTHLLKQPPQPQTLLAFELKLLSQLGLDPARAKIDLTPGATQFLSAFAQSPWEMIPRLKPSAAQAAELGRFLHGFILFHLGRIPKGREAALGLPNAAQQM